MATVAADTQVYKCAIDIRRSWGVRRYFFLKLLVPSLAKSS